jgi:ssDNA-binding Zn-finger/Zn-ribbon topoisomerase 1
MGRQAMMSGGYEYCPYCREITWIEEKCEQDINVGGLLVQTFIKDGNCKICGRKIYIVKVKGVEEASHERD